MKNLYISAPARYMALFCFSSLLLLTTCKDEVVRTRTYHTRVPVYLSVADLRAQALAVQQPQELAIAGKIYIYGDFLFISEPGKGIHVVDNADPAAPRFINFINIPGNNDLAVNNNILYADTYIDLLAFDISNPRNISLAKRVNDVFESYYVDRARGKIVAYKDTVITEVVKGTLHPQVYYDTYYSASSSVKQSYGTGGSMARFALMNSNLYTVDHSSMKLFNVAQPSQPIYLSSINLGGGIETIFPYKDNLFIGSTTGMHIYNAANPAAPVKLSTYRHVTSCDPVVVEGKYAYVTLRAENFCQQGINVLEVLNIENAADPVLVSTVAMKNPHGLTATANDLFVCEGKYGLKAFNRADALNIGQKQLSSLTDIEATDVIAGPKSLIVTGRQGIYQYNYSNPSALKLISHITLNTY